MDREDQVPEADAPRADQLAFAAKHALHDFLLQSFRFSPPDEGMKAPDVEFGEMTDRTGRGTTAATVTFPDGGFHRGDKIDHLPVIPVIIDLAVLADRITEENR
jgi:hypothetical protein